MLRIRPALFRRARLREATGFSVYMLIQDAANKVNYASDPIVIAAVLSTGAVAVWTVAQRLADLVLRLTNQLNESLFPVVVDCDSARRGRSITGTARSTGHACRSPRRCPLPVRSRCSPSRW